MGIRTCLLLGMVGTTAAYALFPIRARCHSVMLSPAEETAAKYHERMDRLQEMAFTDAVDRVIVERFPNYIITVRRGGIAPLIYDVYMAYQEEPRYLNADERKLVRNDAMMMIV